MTTPRRVSSISWPLLAVAVSALTTTACKKKDDSQPPPSLASDANGVGEPSAAPDEEAQSFLTVDDFEEVVGQKTSDVTDCFATAKAAKPDLAGKLSIDFTIDGEGKVREIKVDPASTVNDPALNTCVTDKTKSWQFPKTRDGEPMTLPYTFNLS